MSARPYGQRGAWLLLASLVVIIGLVALIWSTQARVGPGEHPVAPFSAALDGDIAVRLVAVGDIMLGSAFPDSSTLPRSPEALIAPFSSLLRDADLAFGNLEGPLLDSGRSRKCADTSTNCYAFRSPVSYAAVLAGAGFDVLSIANNHILDFDEAGRRSTMRALDAHGMQWTGPAGHIARVTTANGTVLHIVGFAYDNHSNNLLRIPEAVETVRAADVEGAIVIVSFHGGAEGASAAGIGDTMEVFLGEQRGHLRAFARAVIDAGADLVLGHGPHVLRPMELYRGRLIAYSLANFATYARFNLAGPSGIGCVLEVALASDGRLLSGRVHPSMQRGRGGARRDPDRNAIGMLNRMTARDLPGSGVRVAPDGSLMLHDDGAAATR